MDGNVIDFPKVVVSCADCPWARACAGNDCSRSTAESVSQRCPPPMKRQAHVFRQGDKLDSLYVVRSGSAKSYFDNADGLEQIVAFHYPGDLLGFDAVASGHHQTAVVALETMALCRIPFSQFESVAVRTPRLWSDVLRAAARQMIEKNNHALLLGQKSAQARFASLIIYLSNRFAARGCSRYEFNLSMSRQDIANYLSLAVETVSRLFGDFQANGIIAVDRRYVRIVDLERLRQMAGDTLGAKPRVTSG